jgi:hypothetical protein
MPLNGRGILVITLFTIIYFKLMNFNKLKLTEKNFIVKLVILYSILINNYSNFINLKEFVLLIN